MLLYSSVMSASAYELVPLDDGGEISWRFSSLVSKVREPDNAEVKSGHNGTCGGLQTSYISIQERKALV